VLQANLAARGPASWIGNMEEVNVDSGAEDAPCCRICHQGDEAGKLYCPCRCAGSIKWIHESCLCVWLKAQGRRPTCELCGYSFEFLPVYSQHAPQRLTMADWAGALADSAMSLGSRAMRIGYATAVWGIALPLLTVFAARTIFGGWAWLPQAGFRHVMPFIMNVFLGECLSFAGIALIYMIALLRGFLTTVAIPPEEAQTHPLPLAIQESNEQQENVPFPALPEQPQPVEATHALLRPLDGDEALDSEEDLWNIMGLQGDPSRALLCMVAFLCANVIGIGIFLAMPFFIGRTCIRLVLPLIVSQEQGSQLLALWEFKLQGSQLLALWEFKLQPPGHSLLLDLGALLAGYATLTGLLVTLIPGTLLISAALGSPTAEVAAVQARRMAAQAWLKFQTCAVIGLQLVFVPCYIGHLVICLLCGPALHVPQNQRAAMVNANLPLTLLMQVFIGYVHLWGVAFVEGCVTDVCSPPLLQRASSNFFIGAMFAHRRTFGTGLSHGSSTAGGSQRPVPHLTVLKLALFQVALHTPLAFVLWRLPARFLDCIFGETLFPVRLVDRDSSKWNNADAEGQPFFAIEMLQLYMLVLQCLRVLDASPGLTRLIADALRCMLRRLGLQHLLAPFPLTAQQALPPTSPSDAAQNHDSETVPSSQAPAQEQAQHAPALWQVMTVALVLVTCAWVVVMLVLSLPLTVGRMLVRQMLAAQSKRISDFLPLSLGVVVFSALIYAAVKASEVLPALGARAATVEHRRCIRLVLCSFSSLALAIAAVVIIPLGLGALLLSLVLPLKARSVYQVPIMFPITDCWSLGLVLSKVLWRLVQTDTIFHNLYTEFSALSSEVQGSLTNLFFDLRAHRRIWRSIIVPVLELLTAHFIFPQVVVHTLLYTCIPEDQEWLRACMLMFCYHVVLGGQLFIAAVPIAMRSLEGFRQRIFDAKYLVSTELQNYHHGEESQSH